jgi:hypothetical protein
MFVFCDSTFYYNAGFDEKTALPLVICSLISFWSISVLLQQARSDSVSSVFSLSCLCGILGDQSSNYIYCAAGPSFIVQYFARWNPQIFTGYY